MSTCRIKTTLLLSLRGALVPWQSIVCIGIFFLLFTPSLFAEEPIPSFLLTGPSGEVRNSTELFSGRRVVLVVTGKFCLGLQPFLAWRKQISPEKADQALILCVGGATLAGHVAPARGTPEDKGLMNHPPTRWLAADEATKALGITGTPMLLGIEENNVKWRIAGFIKQWQGLAESWLEVQK
jgi:hypothetical protein